MLRKKKHWHVRMNPPRPKEWAHAILSPNNRVVRFVDIHGAGEYLIGDEDKETHFTPDGRSWSEFESQGWKIDTSFAPRLHMGPLLLTVVRVYRLTESQNPK